MQKLGRGHPTQSSDDTDLSEWAALTVVDLAHAVGAERAQDLGATESRAFCESQVEGIIAVDSESSPAALIIRACFERSRL